jgi:hypothetical protein
VRREKVRGKEEGGRGKGERKEKKRNGKGEGRRKKGALT